MSESVNMNETNTATDDVAVRYDMQPQQGVCSRV